MSTQVVDSLSRHAAGISRRGSLLSVGAAGIAALTSSISGEAKKSGKKKRCKDNNKQAEDRCPGQVEPCTDFLDAFCGGRPECLDHSACCDFLETCEVNTFLTCLINQA